MKQLAPDYPEISDYTCNEGIFCLISRKVQASHDLFPGTKDAFRMISPFQYSKWRSWQAFC